MSEVSIPSTSNDSLDYSLAIYNIENLESSIKIAQVGTMLFQKLNKLFQNLTKDFAKAANFSKSGHTVWEAILKWK